MKIYAGWIRLDNTNIDYAIVIGKDNTEYLKHDYNKEFSTAGSIFVDYRNNRDFEDSYSILYGHNMNSNHMFADIKKYQDEEYFNTHKIGKLYTSQGVYKVNVYSYKKVSSFSNLVYNLESNKNNTNEKLIEFFSQDTINKISEDIDKNNKILALSTCDVTDTNVRGILFTYLEKMDDSEIINENTESSLIREEIEYLPINTDEGSISLENNTRKNISLKSIVFIGLIILVVILLVIYFLRNLKRRKKSEK